MRRGEVTQANGSVKIRVCEVGLLVALMLVLLGLLASAAQAVAPYRPGTVLVEFKPGVSAADRSAAERQVKAQRATQLGAASRAARGSRGLDRRIGQIFMLRVARGDELSDVTALRGQKGVQFAEPDYLMRLSDLMTQSGSAPSGTPQIPNDPSFPLQWGSLNTGQTVNGQTGIAGDDDGAAQAWNVTTGSPSIVVGTTDTGLDYTHPDLAANVWSNPGGIGGCPAGTHGYNFVANTCDPMDTDNAYHGHGTHVAGIIGAVGNNGIGVAGMNWSTTILPVKFLNSNSTTLAGSTASVSQLINALDWLLQAQQAGVNVRVVNDSVTFVGTANAGLGQPGDPLLGEIEMLGANGILFVTAAGNGGQNNDTTPTYPCNYDLSNEICVTGINNRDGLPTWANYGPTTVDLAAPGAQIYSTLRNGAYGYITGSSMAAAQVSGAAALILSSGDMSMSALKADILNNVDPLNALSGKVRTGGTLDVCKAIPGCEAVPVNTALPTISGLAAVGQTLTASAGSWSNSPTSYTYAWQRCDSTGSACAPIGGATAASYTVQAADAGSTIRVAVTAVNAGGSSAPATSAPTAVVSATFGTTTVGGSSNPFGVNRKWVNAYSLSVPASVSKLSIYLQNNSTSTSGQQEQVEGVIYADSNGSPGSLLASSTPLTFLSGQSKGWYNLPFSSAVALPAGRYWIGVITGGTGNVARYRYSTVTASRDYNVNSFASGPSNPFGSPSTDSQQMSLYATYTPN
ncbi:MAG: S8 family serine peptidase [Solirubrobacteraceae bacterium]